MRAAVLLTLLAVAACGVRTGERSDSICTISDCPEGVTLAQMRSLTLQEAYDDGAPRTVSVGCTGSGPGHVTCWVEFFDKRTVCNWSGCNADGSECDEFEECHACQWMGGRCVPI